MTSKKTAMRINYQQHISQGQFYTLLYTKIIEKFLLLNFQREVIKVNESSGVVQMRNESLFSWQHPIIELNGISMFLFNVRSWNGHLEYFLVTRYTHILLSM